MKVTAQVARLWRTVRHLRPVQIYGRVFYRLRRPQVDGAGPPKLREAAGRWTRPAARRQSLIGPTRFQLLHQEHDIAVTGWDDPNVSKLLRYNLHYFDDLQAQDWQSRSTWHSGLIGRWIEGNPPAGGSGWEPYPTSLRIINWIKWSLSGGGLEGPAIASLAVQVRWLAQRLEWHLLGNHLFVNAKALVFAGCFFEGAEADHWLEKGLAIISGQLDEQFLGDGAQFELSPMYHALGLEDLLDLLNLSQAYPARLPDVLRQRLADAAARAVAWLVAMTHPDGQIAFFNDAAFGVAPDNAELFGVAQALGLEPKPNETDVWQGRVSGYVRLSRGEAVLLADFAAVGPTYLPGHAHADTLSFEFSLFGQRVFVNSGTSEYGIGAERLRQRGTAAHNTVNVAGLDSSEVWGGFRVGRRARVEDIVVTNDGKRLIASARHDGYRFLAGRPDHKRHFALMADRLVVADDLSVSMTAEARFHLHPDIVVLQHGEDRARLQLPDGARLQIEAAGGPMRMEPATWHPEFGVSRVTSCLVLPLAKGAAQITATWEHPGAYSVSE